MRKVSTTVLIAMSALALAGCNKQETAPADPASEAGAIAASEAAPAASDASAAASDAAAPAASAAASETAPSDPNGNPVKP